eukprot:TRINITY_DN383_c0_g1_i1.p1 TRINITY_DN383_c0_g1~~TRINITY_DN383_c0_g1_i1.p1  ORF type:complete len:3114 (+),score=1080.15 TRINITY_DN383_c0_g1_i1:153-9494(+)
MASLHLSLVLLVAALAIVSADDPTETPMPLSQPIIANLDYCEYKYYKISVPKGVTAPGYLRVDFTQNTTGALNAFLSPDVLPNQVHANATTATTQNQQEAFFDSLCEFPSSDYYFVVKGSAQSATTKMIATASLSPPQPPRALNPDGTTIKDVVLGNKAYNFFSLKSPDNGTSPSASMVVTIKNIRGKGALSVYVNNGTVAGPGCALATMATCSDTCTIPVSRCDFVGADWIITVRNYAGVQLTYDIQANVTIPTTSKIAIPYSKQHFVKPADYFNYQVQVGSNRNKRIRVTVSGALRGTVNVTLTEGNDSGSITCNGRAGMTCTASPACSIVVPACATDVDHLDVTVIGINPNSDARISYQLTAEASDDDVVTLDDGKAVPATIESGVVDLYKFDVPSSLAVDEEMVVKLYVKTGSSHSLTLVATNQTGGFDACDNPLSSNAVSCSTSNHCEILIDRCSVTKGTWFIGVVANEGFPFTTPVNYTVETYLKKPVSLVNHQAVVGYATSQEYTHYAFDVPSVSPGASLNVYIEATETSDITFYVHKGALAGCTSCYSADFQQKVASGDAGVISIPSCLVSPGTWYIGVHGNTAAKMPTFSLKVHLVQPDVSSLSVSQPLTNTLNLGDSAVYSLSSGSDAETMTITLITNPRGQSTAATGTVGLTLFNSTFSEVRFGRDAIQNQASYADALCITESCSVDSGTTACVVRIPPCFLRSGNWHAVISAPIPSKDTEILEVEYTLNVETASTSQGQLVAGTPITKTSQRPIQSTPKVSVFDHYSFDVSNIKSDDRVYVEVTLYADDSDVTLYLNSQGRQADDGTCYGNRLSCEVQDGQCSIVLQACELDGGKWDASVYLADKPGASKPVTYTLEYDVRQPEILTSGVSVTSRIAGATGFSQDTAGKLRHYKLEVGDIPNEGALLDIELTSVSSGSLVVYANIDELAGCSECLGYLDSCESGSECTITIPPCSLLAKSDYYIAVGFGSGASKGDDGFVLTATVRDDGKPSKSVAGRQNNGTVDAYQVKSLLFSKIPTSGSIDFVVLNPTSKKNSYTFYAVPLNRANKNNTVQCLSATCSYVEGQAICASLTIDNPESTEWMVSLTGTSGPSDYSVTMYETKYVQLLDGAAKSANNVPVGKSSLFQYTQGDFLDGSWLLVKVNGVSTNGAVEIKMNFNSPVQNPSGEHIFQSYPGTCGPDTDCTFYIPTCDLRAGDYYITVTAVAGPVAFTIVVNKMSPKTGSVNGDSLQYGYGIYQYSASTASPGDYLDIVLKSSNANNTNVPAITVARQGAECSYVKANQISSCCFDARTNFVQLIGPPSETFDLTFTALTTPALQINQPSAENTVLPGYYRQFTVQTDVTPGASLTIKASGLTGDLYFSSLEGPAGDPKDAACYHYDKTTATGKAPGCSAGTDCYLLIEPCFFTSTNSSVFAIGAKGASSKSSFTVIVSQGGDAPAQISSGQAQSGTLKASEYKEFEFKTPPTLGPLAYLRFKENNNATISTAFNPGSLAGFAAGCSVKAKTTCSGNSVPLLANGRQWTSNVPDLFVSRRSNTVLTDRTLPVYHSGHGFPFANGSSPSPSPNATASPSASPSASPNVTQSPSPSPSPSASPSPSPSPSASPSASPSSSPSASPSASPSPSPNPFPNSCVAIPECDFHLDNQLAQVGKFGNQTRWYMVVHNLNNDPKAPDASYNFEVEVVDPQLLPIADGYSVSGALNEDYIAGFKYSSPPDVKKGDYLNVEVSNADVGTVITVRPIVNSSMDCDSSFTCTAASDGTCSLQVDSCAFSGLVKVKTWIVKAQGGKSGSVTVKATRKTPVSVVLDKQVTASLSATGIYQMFTLVNISKAAFVNVEVTISGDTGDDSITAYANPLLPAGASSATSCYQNMGSCTVTNTKNGVTSCYIPVPPCAFNQTHPWFVSVMAKSGKPNFSVEAKTAKPVELQSGIESDQDYLSNNEYALYRFNSTGLNISHSSYLVVTVEMADDPCASVTATPYIIDPNRVDTCHYFSKTAMSCDTSKGKNTKTCQVIVDVCDFIDTDWYIAILGATSDKTLANYYVTAELRNIDLVPVSPFEVEYMVGSVNGDTVTEYVWSNPSPAVGSSYATINLFKPSSDAVITVRTKGPVGVNPSLKNGCRNEKAYAASTTCSSGVTCTLAFEPCLALAGDVYIHITGTAYGLVIDEIDLDLPQLQPGVSETYTVNPSGYSQFVLAVDKATPETIVSAVVNNVGNQPLEVYINRDWYASDSCYVEKCASSSGSGCYVAAGNGPASPQGSVYCTEDSLEGNWFVSVKNLDSSDPGQFTITGLVSSEMVGLRQFDAHQCDAVGFPWSKTYTIPLDTIEWPSTVSRNRTYLQVDLKNTGKNSVQASPSTGRVSGLCSANSYSSGFEYSCIDGKETYVTVTGQPGSSYDIAVSAVEAPVYELEDNVPLTTSFMNSSSGVYHFAFNSGNRTENFLLSADFQVTVNDPSKSGATVDVVVSESHIAQSLDCALYSQTHCTSCGFDQLCFPVQPNTWYYATITTNGGPKGGSKTPTFTITAQTVYALAPVVVPNTNGTALSLDNGKKAVFKIPAVKAGQNLTVTIDKVHQGAVTAFLNYGDHADQQCYAHECTADSAGCQITLSGCDVPPGDWYVTIIGNGEGICANSPFVVSVNVTDEADPDDTISTEPLDVSLMAGETKEWKVKKDTIDAGFAFFQITNLVGELEIDLKQTQNTTCATLKRTCSTRACLFTVFPCLLGADLDQIYVSITPKLLGGSVMIPGSNVTFTMQVSKNTGSDSATLNTTQADYGFYQYTPDSAKGVTLTVSEGIVEYAVYPAHACNNDPVYTAGSVAASETGHPLVVLNELVPDSPYWKDGFVVILTGGAPQINSYKISPTLGQNSAPEPFCQSYVGYGVEGLFGKPEVDPRDTRAEAEYAILVQSFGCPTLGSNKPAGMCTACSNYVNPDCDDALKKFACWDSFRAYSNGKIQPICTDVCDAVQAACGVTWEEANMQQFRCNTTFYSTSDEVCTGSPSSIHVPTNTGGGSGGAGKSGGKSKTTAIVIGSVAGVVVLAGVAFGLSKVMGGGAAAGAGASGGSAAAAGGASSGAAASSGAGLKEPLLPDAGGAGAGGADAASAAV